MKHLKKINEQEVFDFSKASIDSNGLISTFEDLIMEYVTIEDVPYALEDGLKQINDDSRKQAAIAIYKYLKERNIV